MAFLKQSKTPEEIKMIGISAVRSAYNDLASDYNKIVNYDWIFCPKCGEFLAATTFYSDDRFVTGKFPICNYSVDMYTNWLTQNSVNLGLGIASAGLTVVGGAGLMMTGGGSMQGASSILSGSMQIANILGQVYQHSLQPNSAKGNVNGGDINTCSGNNGFFFYNVSIKQEYARIIDNYFSMFGYKINRVKLPNITGRLNWNYVKTIDCNFDGDIPQTDLNIIKQMFNNGVTLWHNPSTMYDYSNNNNII